MRRPRATPWHPFTTIWVTLFLLPLAGALVTMVNLVRLGQVGKALFALITGLGSTLLIFGLWTAGPGGANRVLPLVLILSLGDVGLYLSLQWPDYRAWRQAQAPIPGADPWIAAAWGLLGFVAFVILWVLWAVLWAVLTP